MSLTLITRTIKLSLRSPLFKSPSIHKNLYNWSYLSQIRATTFSTGKIYFTGDETLNRSTNKLPPTNPDDILNTPLARFRKKIGLYALTRNTMRLSAAYLYVACTDKVPVELFFKELKLPDTYFSWFVVTELHMWMIMSRLMAEGKEGKFARNELVKCLWDDCDQRLRLYKLSGKTLRNMMMTLSDQFRAAVVAYDEVGYIYSSVHD